jgi:hypothetical protein
MRFDRSTLTTDRIALDRYRTWNRFDALHHLVVNICPDSAEMTAGLLRRDVAQTEIFANSSRCEVDDAELASAPISRRRGAGLGVGLLSARACSPEDRPLDYRGGLLENP